MVVPASDYSNCSSSGWFGAIFVAFLLLLLLVCMQYLSTFCHGQLTKANILTFIVVYQQWFYEKPFYGIVILYTQRHKDLQRARERDISLCFAGISITACTSKIITNCFTSTNILCNNSIRHTNKYTHSQFYSHMNFLTGSKCVCVCFWCIFSCLFSSLFNLICRS